MSLPSPWDVLEATDMPAGGLQILAGRLGPRVAAQVWKTTRGTRLEPPKSFPKAFMVRYIHLYWDGTNTAELARTLQIHQRTVERYLEEKIEALPPSNPQLMLI